MLCHCITPNVFTEKLRIMILSFHALSVKSQFYKLGKEKYRKRILLTIYANSSIIIALSIFAWIGLKKSLTVGISVKIRRNSHYRN